MPDDSSLLAALAVIQARGAIGTAPLVEAVAHADQFVAAVPVGARRLVDLGSGGGLPGLVIAVRRPDLQIVLVERRHSRADLLRRAIHALALEPQVEVFGADVRDLARDHSGSFDVVTARSFAAPEITLRWASVLLHVEGVLVVSEPPTDTEERWPVAALERCRLLDLGRDQGVRSFRRY